MSSKQENLIKLLAECKSIVPVHAGRSDADYKFQKRVNAAIDLLIAYIESKLDV